MCWLALAQIGAVSVPLNEHYRLQEVPNSSFRNVISIALSLSRLPSYLSVNKEDLPTLYHYFSLGRMSGSGHFSLQQVVFDGGRLDESCEILPEDTAVIPFTSGTTQYPKGVIYTHCNVVYGGIIHMRQIGMCPGDRFLSILCALPYGFFEMAAMSVIVARCYTDHGRALQRT